jgi:hypothetical protein
VHRRSFVYRGAASELLGRELPDWESFPNQVEAWMRELDMMDNVLAWVCPVVPHFPDVAARIGIPFIVADVIDDQRRWPMIPRYRTEIETNYRETFEIADVVVANCGPVADWLAGEGLDPLIVPNGMEIHHDVDSWREPPDSAGYPRPIVAYAGSLTARIDWPLIASLAQARPHWSIVLIGATPRSEAFRSVAALPNVHVLGVVPYERATRLLAAADAAMIPHETGWLTQAMNPLKLYVYRSLGLPVVSTPVGNIDDFRDEVRIAATPEAFVSALDQAIEERRRVGRCYPDPARVGTLTWEARLAAILEEAERVLARRGRTPLAQPA